MLCVKTDYRGLNAMWLPRLDSEIGDGMSREADKSEQKL